jgi:hypothetical protein
MATTGRPPTDHLSFYRKINSLITPEKPPIVEIVFLGNDLSFLASLFCLAKQNLESSWLDFVAVFLHPGDQVSSRRQVPSRTPSKDH